MALRKKTSRYVLVSRAGLKSSTVEPVIRQGKVVGYTSKKKYYGEKYKKQTKQPLLSFKQEAKIRKGVVGGLRGLFGVPMPSYYQHGVMRQGGKSATRGRVGRPRGTFRYSIQGKPVDVYTYRRYMARMRAMERLQPQQYPQQYQTYPSQEYTPPQSPQVISQPPVSRPAGDGNILNAPNIMKGEMMRQNTDGYAFRGPDQTSRPVTNPMGDYYIEVEPASGRQILRRRIRERWLSGE